MEKFVCIHGHFYQPPRENAWLEVVELQDSAYPFHDWNARITNECYAPNADSRILNGEGVITEIVNNYSRISFNFGPTLLSWLEENDPETYQGILDADKLSMDNFAGHGSAIAQVYNHIIMPLANRRDKETQVIWGIHDFERRFKRKPEGMWLAETAVDTETLEVLAENNIKFTILAPRQAKSIRKIGTTDWENVGINVDPRRPYLCKLPSGKQIFLFFYDGNLSQSVAFNGLLNNGEVFANKLKSGFGDGLDQQLVHIATDGESYGHHHKHGDMALAFCLEAINQDENISLTNYGEVLDIFDVTHEAQIVEDSSWSCVHGVGRWKENCGCHTGGHSDWSQQWRDPLRRSLDWLRDELETIYEKEAGKYLKSPWNARNEYIDVILDRDSHQKDFLEAHKIKEEDVSTVLRLMEMQRNALLMYTSCGWFFDEVSGIETTQILQYACRAIQLALQEGEVDLEPGFLEILAEAKSNLPQYDTAVDVYKEVVIPTRLTLARVGVHYAVASIFEEDPESMPVFNYIPTSDYLERREAGAQKITIGKTRVKSRVTQSEKEFQFAVLYLGQQNIIGNISITMTDDDFEEFGEKFLQAFDSSQLGVMISLLMEYFGPSKYTLWHLFKDEKRKALNIIMENSMKQLENSFRKIYNRDYTLMNTLKSDDIPIPNAYRTTLQYVLNADLRNALLAEKIDINELVRIQDEFEKWGFKIDDTLYLQRYASEMVLNSLKRIRVEKHDLSRVERLNFLFDYIKVFGIEPELHKTQNLYFEMSRDERLMDSVSAAWKVLFQELGDKLGIKVSQELLA